MLDAFNSEKLSVRGTCRVSPSSDGKQGLRKRLVVSQNPTILKGSHSIEVSFGVAITAFRDPLHRLLRKIASGGGVRWDLGTSKSEAHLFVRHLGRGKPCTVHAIVDLEGFGRGQSRSEFRLFSLT